jgi:hypothetical protein
MTDSDQFEARLHERMRAYAATARRHDDPASTARAAIAGAVQRRPVGLRTWLVERLALGVRSASLEHRARPGLLMIVILGVLVAVSAVSIGRARLEPSPPPAPPPPAAASSAPMSTPIPTDPSPSTLPTPGPSYVPLSPGSAGTFEPTGSLAFRRTQHVAVMLADGRVLVIGGDPADAPWPQIGRAPAELYDPGTGRFRTLDVEALRRGVPDTDGFTATALLDGRVLVTGGSVDDIAWPPIARSDAFLFDPRTGAASETGPMTTARTGHAAIRLTDGRVLIVGGLGVAPDGSPRNLASAEIFDPVTGEFSAAGSMLEDRWNDLSTPLAVVLLPSERVLVRGGASLDFAPDGTIPGLRVPSEDEVYDPSSGRFRAVADVSADGRDVDLVMPYDGRIHRYDMTTGTAVDITPEDPEVIEAYGFRCRELPFDCRGGMTVATLADGRILLVGGYEVLLDSGWPGVDRTTAEVFDPTSGSRHATGPTTETRVRHTATLLADGRVLVIGGEDRRGEAETRVILGSAEVFTPAP